MTQDRQDRNYQQPVRPEQSKLPDRKYVGPAKMKDVASLLDDVEDLVHNGTLADAYKQQGGQ